MDHWTRRWLPNPDLKPWQTLLGVVVVISAIALGVYLIWR